MDLSTFDRARLTTATPEDPLRVLVSACMIGHPTGWEGEPYPSTSVQELAALPNVRAVPFCPEQVTLGTPRPLTIITGGDGYDVLDGNAKVLDTDGVDRTKALLTGAQALLEHAQRERVELCLMLDLSDSCGSNVIYDGHHTPKKYREGVGVSIAMLLRAGFPVISQRDDASLGRIRAALDPTYTSPTGTFDFTEHPWFVETFRSGSR